MEIRTRRNFAIKLYFAVILEYLILLCTVAAGSDMSNVPNGIAFLGGVKNGNNEEMFKKCLICGRSHAGPEENILNGNPVEPPNKYPWMVQLNFDDLELCGGAILDGHHILTAAHCFFKEQCLKKMPQESCKRTPNELKISLQTAKPKEFQRGPPVADVFIHPKFKLPFFYNDIAVVKLQNPIICDEFSSPICLPPPSFSVPDKSILTIAGWGNTGHEPEGSLEVRPLLEANVLILDAARCGFSEKAETGIHCVTGTDGKSPCFGDSGGPMFFFQEKVFYTLGLTSAHSSKDCDPAAPVVYTDVSKFMMYIQKITGLQSAHEMGV